MLSKKVILGIDPGTQTMGFGAIIINQDKPELLGTHELKLDKITDPYRKLREIYQTSKEQIDYFKPHEIAIESLFYATNPQSLLKLGRAQGVAIAAVISKNVSVTEYSPRKVKKSITGRGDASKEQIAKMLMNILSLKSIPNKFDITDALAVAMCHYYNRNSMNLGKPTYGSWSSFIKDNSHRIADRKKTDKD
ncbi:MAG: crossover junction endodeoxyribonuclease RuvC [Flavobacteriaceae bacterium]|nr:crossover junction endodeoxyribonuclease RuvC [Flavobacteriaceae bacterium]